MSIGLFTVADLNDVPDPVAFETWAGLTTDGQLYVYNGAGWTQITGGAGTVSSVGLAGTANQIAVAGASPITGAGSWTLSIPTNPVLPGTASGTFSGNLTGNVTGIASGNLTSATGVASVSKNGSAQLHGDVTLSQGSNVTLTQSGQDISIAATGGEAGVSSISAEGSPATPLTGAVTLSEGSNVTLTQVGNDIEIAASGAAAGVDSISVSGSPATLLTGDVTLSEGSNITLTQVGQDIEIAASGGASGLTLVEHKVISGTISTTTFSGLDGDTDGVYLLTAKILNANGTFATYNIRPNGNSSNMFGDVQYIDPSTHLWGGIGTGGCIGFTNDNASWLQTTVVIHARQSISGVDAPFSWSGHASNRDTSNVVRRQVFGGEWVAASAANLTSLEVIGSGTNGIAAGSELFLYKLAQ